MKRRTGDDALAYKLYRKHICGRGYAWPVGCSLPEDIQNAIKEAIAKTRAACVRVKVEEVPE